MSKVSVGTFWILVALALPESQAKAADAFICSSDAGSDGGSTVSTGTHQQTACGVNNTSSFVSGTAIGTNNSSIVFGATSAIGSGNTIRDLFGNMFGTDNVGSARGSGHGNSALGSNNVVSGSYGGAFGADNRASGVGSRALGAFQNAQGRAAVAIGYGDGANAGAYGAFGKNGVAIGYRAVAGAADDAMAFGAESRATAAQSVAVGAAAQTDGARAVAIGSGTVAAAENGLALGAQAQATVADGVALGSDAVAAAPHVGRYTLSGAAAAGESLAGGSVGVGQPGAERQIQNVAAGVIAPTSTDAVNGSQLYDVATATQATIDVFNNNISNLYRATFLILEDQQALAKKSYEGTAIALALAPGFLPEDKTFGVSVHFGTFRDQNAIGANALLRVTDSVTLDGGVGAGLRQNGWSGRVALNLAW